MNNKISQPAQVVFIALLLLFSISIVSATTSLSEASVCCEKTNSGASCINTQEANCNTAFSSAPTSCESTSFCETGTCYNPTEGNCIQNTPKSTCEVDGGVWTEDHINNVPQCQLGCCVISDQAAFVSKTRCSRLSSFVGVQADYFTDVDDEFMCILLAQGSQMGACVFDQGPDRTCTFSSRQECDGEESFLGLNETNENGKKFYADVLCSAEELGTNCEKQYNTGCSDGKVYNYDSCGNQENIYSSNEDKSNNEGRVAEDDEICDPVAGSNSCGNCDYLLGGICTDKDNNFGEAGVNNFCQATTCRDRDGVARKNGESWCVYDGKIGSGSDTAGSRHFREVCLNGEVVTEGCADYRNEVCIHDSLDNGFDVAACRVNLWQDCTSQSKKSDCLNSDSRDCVFYSAVRGISFSGSTSYSSAVSSTQSNYGTAATAISSGFTGNVIVGTGTDSSEYDANIVVVDTTQDRNESTNGLCVPNFPPGLQFWNSGSATSQCAQASASCTITLEESMDITGDKEWKITNGTECLATNKVNVSQTWAEQANQVCVAMGDCGGYVNFQGKFTQDGYVLKNANGAEERFSTNAINRINIMSLTGVFTIVGNAISELVSGESSSDASTAVADVADTVGTLSGQATATTNFLGQVVNFLGETTIITSSRRGYNQATSRIDSLRSNRDRLTGRLENTQSQLRSAQSQLRSAQSRFAGLESESGFADDDAILANADALREAQSNIDKFEEEISSLGTRQSAITREQERIQSDVDRAQVRIDNYRAATNIDLDGQTTGENLGAIGLRGVNFIGATLDTALKSIALGEAAEALLINIGTSQEDAEAQGLGIAAAIATYRTMGNLFNDETGLYRGAPALDNNIFRGAVSLAVGWYTYTEAYEDTRTETVTFECKPWQAPIGQNDCGQCSANDLPCSEYRCKSLGPSCGIVNEGTSEVECVDMSLDDARGPIITPNEEELTDGFVYSEISDRGFTIESAAGGCLPSFSSLQWGIRADEPAQCKVDIRHTGSFDDMRYYLGGSNIYSEEHTEFLAVPNSRDLANLSAGGIQIQNGNEMEIYLRCRDGNANVNGGEGNIQEAEYAVRFCVDETPDVTPPQVISSSIEAGSCVAANTDTATVTFYTNEPASCRWDRQDRSDFSDMQYSMVCSRSAVDTGRLMVYPCVATFTGINKEDTPYYIRCQDEQGNDNDASYDFSLKGSLPLKMMDLSPNETIRSGSTQAEVNLYAETMFGCGNAICFYSQTGLESDFTTFKDTNTDDGVHIQQLFLGDGFHTMNFKCVDAGGNVAENSTSFEVDIDTNAPEIVRAYEDDNLLKIVTVRDAVCAFTTDNCDFLVDEGEKLLTSTGRENIHMTEWIKDTNYYVKCKDNFNNEELGCSIIVRPTDNFL